jgi:ATP-dependent helicase/nuclease subunit B
LFTLASDVAVHLERGGTLIVPTQQRLRAVQLAQAAVQLAGQRRVWASADVLTPSRWARRECERRAEEAPQAWPRVLGATEEWLLWREAAQRAAQGYPFLDTDLLAESLQRASERAAEYDITLVEDAPESESALLHAAQRGFEARCRALQAASVSALTSRLYGTQRPGQLLLRGFSAISPGLAALVATPVASEAPTPLAAAAVRVVRTADAQSQMEAVAAWCQTRLSAQPDARLLVMLPGPAGGRERLAALIRDSLDPRAALVRGGALRALVGIEGGEPFAALALPAHALLALALVAGAAIEMGQIGRWLMAPYWTTPTAASRAQLAQLLRASGPARLDLRELLGALQLAPRELKFAARELDTLLRQAQRKLGDGGASARRWSERFESALTALGWPGALEVGSTPQQVRLRWRELLEEFGELALCAGSLSLDAALGLLRALARRTSYRPGDEGAPVTLSSVLADPVVIYDGIWVGSLAADQLPQPPAPDPFLPLHAQRAAGIPEASAAGRRAQADALLAAWRRGARELVLSVPAQEEDRQLLPSPYLAGLTAEEHTPRPLWLPLRLHQPGSIERLADVRGTAFNPLRPLPSGTRALTLQNACAFRAYAELRLGAAPPEEPEPGVPMQQRGLLLHAALQMLWERLHDSHTLGALADGALEALIGECVTQAARALQAEISSRRRRARRAPDAQFDLFTVLSPALERECQRARGLILKLCLLERTRPPFVVEATEHTAELVLGGGRVRMRLDRIDRLADGRIVLDYKSGRPGSPDWFGDRPTHPQLLAYLAALGSDVIALATVNLTAREVRFTGVAATGELLPKVKALTHAAPAAAGWRAQQRSWQSLIERLIREFLSGEAQVDPAPGACDYCHVTDICRIRAHLAPESPAHADESDE